MNSITMTHLYADTRKPVADIKSRAVINPIIEGVAAVYHSITDNETMDTLSAIKNSLVSIDASMKKQTAVLSEFLCKVSDDSIGRQSIKENIIKPTIEEAKAIIQVDKILTELKEITKPVEELKESVKPVEEVKEIIKPVEELKEPVKPVEEVKEITKPVEEVATKDLNKIFKDNHDTIKALVSYNSLFQVKICQGGNLITFYTDNVLAKEFLVKYFELPLSKTSFIGTIVDCISSKQINCVLPLALYNTLGVPLLTYLSNTYADIKINNHSQLNLVRDSITNSDVFSICRTPDRMMFNCRILKHNEPYTKDVMDYFNKYFTDAIEKTSFKILDDHNMIVTVSKKDFKKNLFNAFGNSTEMQAKLLDAMMN